jgi:pyruvate dehydrogenase (quinone)
MRCTTVETAVVQNASDVLVETLIEWGVEMIFGLPGDGINGIVEALRTRQERIRFVQVRHEAAAAFMACGYAKWTGKLGVCFTTTGPGGTNLLTGLYDAKFDHAPVLAITGLPFHNLIQTYTQQDIDHTKVFQDVAAYSTALYGARHVRPATLLACRTALSERGVAHLAIPADVLEQEVERDLASPQHQVDPIAGFAGNPQIPDAQAVAAAASILNAGRKVAILAGQGALRAGDELERTADLLAAPIAKALLGKAVLDDDHPHVTGGVGYLGARPSQQVFAACDTLLIVGSGFPYIEYYPKPDQVRTVQIDIDGRRMGLRYPVEAPVAGDAAASLRALNDQLERKSDRSLLAQAQAWKSEWLQALEQGAKRLGKPMKPQRVVHELNRQLAGDAVIAVDSGHNTGLAAQYLMVGKGQAFGMSGTLASMGCGLRYANAAALAFPARPLLAVVGDGGLAMSLGELATAVHYKLPIKVVVINNSVLAQIKWEQMLFLGNPEFGCALAPIDFTKVAECMGMLGLRTDDRDRIGDLLAQALRHDGPALVDAVVDANEPMLPPKRRDQYMKHLAEAFEVGTAGQDEIERRLREEPAVISLKP